LPFSWPFQAEEWEFHYRTVRGFNIFIVEDEKLDLNSTARSYRSLHQQIKERCELDEPLLTTRALSSTRVR
jgi:hypothetical protein